ncbi:hypothetical protein T484DRAFT_1922660 [Baffinella frigidus]|nr:hypothetical protein T484DRAFT_1922660 [Cryptophyta sp. CCMP2293]
MASNPDVIISGMLGPPDAFALLCRGGAPPARQKRGRTLGVGMAQGGEQRPRAERAAAAGEPSASRRSYELQRAPALPIRRIL